MASHHSPEKRNIVGYNKADPTKTLHIPTTTNKDKVLKLIIEKPRTRKELIELTGYKEKSIDGIISRLRKEAMIKDISKGKYAYIDYNENGLFIKTDTIRDPNFFRRECEEMEDRLLRLAKIKKAFE